MREITEIFVHCSDTRPEWMKDRPLSHKIQEIDRWHKERGWAGIGYHIVLDRDGKIGNGRDISQIGAHVKGHNKNSIGVVLIGGHGGAADDKFEDNFTNKQKITLLKVLEDLTSQFPNAKIRGHNEVAAKACPTFNVKEFLDANRKQQQTEDLQEGSGSTAAPSSFDLGSIVGWILNALSRGGR